ncbi:MAG TPA: 16S rRNA (guanine(966)-N(2))-methyltransferase RsmD [Bacillota bacterium]|nr:16S rRNA (guanine(966)-N(2))-methyltransferase RsmD [Bacillota bacterium]
MRIIAGKYRGRKLKTLSGRHTRPTTDKIKESIFQRLGPFFSGGTCLDLFSGSGALGIEALSRGFDRAVFVDNHRQAVQTIRHNIQLLKLSQEQATILQSDAFHALRRLNRQGKVFQMIFIDPPYYEIDFSKLLTEISEQALLSPDGIVYCEHGVDEILPKQVAHLTRYNQFSYGKTTSISLYHNDRESD